MGDGDKKQLGKILLKRKLISPAELERALTKQRESAIPTPLASVLMESGALTETEALKALSEQFGVPGLDLSQIAIDLTCLDMVPREVAERKHVLPVLVQGEQLFIAVADPTDQRTIDELEFVTGRKVRPYIALKATLEATARRAYDAKARGEAYFFGPNVSEDVKRQVGHGATSVERASVPPDAEPMDIELSELGPNDWSSVTTLPHDDAKGSSGKKILVVEDEAEIRQLLVRMLSNQGHRVLEADRGLLALERVKEHSPDLIILDAMLPELHGFEIARRLKASERYGKIPILMLSAVHRGWRVAEDAKSNLKIEEYIEKPFRISEVVAAVTRLLQQKGQGEIKRDPEALADEARRHLDEGVEAYKAGDLKRATVALKRATEVDPLAFRARYHLGLLYAKVGKPFEAIGELERAAELNPMSFPTLKNLAVLYEQAGFRNKAAEVWERALQATQDAQILSEVRQHVMRLLQ